MKKFLRASTLLLLFGFMSTAMAATYKSTFSIEEYMEARVVNPETYAWTFDINPAGFDPSSEYITNINITLLFEDDDDTTWYEIGRTIERAQADIGDFSTGHWLVKEGAKEFAFTSLGDLGVTGILDLLVTAREGDFIFLGGILTVDTAPSAVPAPSALLLMGSGLIGVATAARRKKAKKA